MPCWYYEKSELRNTPSIQDGIDYETECRYRKEGARFIIDTGSKMDLGYNTMATGVVYFHRFYMFHSFKNFPRYVSTRKYIPVLKIKQKLSQKFITGHGLLLFILSWKSRRDTKKVQRYYKNCKNAANRPKVSYFRSRSQGKKTFAQLLPNNFDYITNLILQEEVMTLERILLQTIKFDLQVEHPYSFLLKYAKCLKGLY